MNSKKKHKLSKASVAAVLATSGILVAMPHETSAKTFNDLNLNADYYQPVIDLSNRNIATGYSDGTFRPNTAITRADAARMLALSINIKTSNPKNPKFKDIQASNPNYKYIAALAEAGIINGYPDNTFKPNEYITRGQMAKILTLGYKFGVSTKLTNTFKDVPATNGSAYYIQTLVDLKITKGKTPVTFEPSSTVTRGQMATFIWRAEKADKGNPIYTVGDITDERMYINGVAYTIAPALRSIFNAANKRILKGAQIEGSFTSTTLKTVSKLTLNASGTSTSLLALDGDDTTFGGELIINGSYVRLKNIQLTGRVEVAETPRKSLSRYMTNPLQNTRIASINGFGFIDWDKPTEPDDEGFLNPDDNENLTGKPDPSLPSHKQPYKTRMPKIEKYVDFSNSTVNNLYITQNRSFVSAEDTIDRLTVQQDVEQYELYADANAMYIDTDVNVTVFGVNDVKYVYKNTLKNMFFHTDSYYDYLYVTNSNGYIDIGDHVYIDQAIIPPNKTPNDIFDDYENDDGNIGWIEDENGKPVDRDPVEDTIIKDETAPKILELAVTPGGTLANVSLTANEDGTYYYMVKKADEKAPSISEIKKGGGEHSGKGPIKQDTPVNFTVNDLETLTEYTIYVIVIDGSENVSNKASKNFKTIDGQPPSLELSGEPMPGGKRIQLAITPSEAGRYYYYIRPIRLDAEPTVDEIIKNHTFSEQVTKPGKIVIPENKYGAKPNLQAIQPSTEYDIFAVMVDTSGNKMRTVKRITIKTGLPDLEHPYVKSVNLERDTSTANIDKNYFYLTVNEKLDKKSAEDVNNYILSGTGIVNVTGQKEIKPSEVVYEEKSNRVRLSLPSITGFVKGDTLRVTVLPGVTDLAENPFENINTVPAGQAPRNYADYKHDDSVEPKIKIDNVIKGQTKAEVEITTSKAGTYYYMILPETFDFQKNGITSRDFVDEFSNDPQINKWKFGTTKKEYLKLGNDSALLGKMKFDVMTDQLTLDPFTPYGIFMVLRDRSGQLSEIVSSPLIGDSKPPLTRDFDVKPKANSNSEAILSMDMDEKGTVFYLAVQKWVIDPQTNTRIKNPAIHDQTGNLIDSIKDSNNMNLTNQQRLDAFRAAKATGIFGEKSVSKAGKVEVDMIGLAAHEEYVVYAGVTDTFGNFTVKSSSGTNGPNEPSGPVLRKEFYTDGVAPYIEKNGVIHRSINGENFTITFNEAIMRQKGDTDITKYNQSSILNNTSFKIEDILEIKGSNNPAVNIADKFEVVSYTVGAKTTNESNLVIKPKVASDANQALTVTMKDKSKAYDYVDQNGFDLTKIGKYIYRQLTSDFVEITRIGAGATASSSHKVKAVFDITSTDPTFTFDEELTYYYASYSGALTTYVANLTEERIVEIAKSITNLDSALSRGKGSEKATSGRTDIDLNHSTGFYNGDWLVVVLEDKYGNLMKSYQKVGYKRP